MVDELESSEAESLEGRVARLALFLWQRKSRAVVKRARLESETLVG